MVEPADLRVVISSRNGGLARNIRMALTGAGLRGMSLTQEPLETVRVIAGQDPHAVIVHVEGPENDEGLKLVTFLRRWEKSPNREVPIIAVSSRRDLGTISAVMNAGANEFALLPPTGDVLLKKVVACLTPREFIQSADYVGPCRRRRADPAYAGPERRVVAPQPVVLTE
jgi:PleD family two-component response regulator